MAAPAPVAPAAPARPRHSYWFKAFHEYMRDPVARQELEVLKQAISAENPHVRYPRSLIGLPSVHTPVLYFQFVSSYPGVATRRTFVLDGETGNIRMNPHRAGDLFISPALEAQILAFLRNHVRTSNAFNIRRHALEAFGRAQVAPAVTARRTRRSRRARKTQRSRK